MQCLDFSFQDRPILTLLFDFPPNKFDNFKVFYNLFINIISGWGRCWGSCRGRCLNSSEVAANGKFAKMENLQKWKICKNGKFASKSNCFPPWLSELVSFNIPLKLSLNPRCWRRTVTNMLMMKKKTLMTWNKLFCQLDIWHSVGTTASELDNKTEMA